MKVVDASAVCDFLLGRRAALEVLTADAGDDQQPLHCPELVEPETLNALRRLVRGGHLTARDAAAAVRDLGDLRMVRYPHAPLRPRVWELRDRLTAYDATYLALAEGLDGSVLVTADAALAAEARATLGDGRVRQVV